MEANPTRKKNSASPQVLVEGTDKAIEGQTGQQSVAAQMITGGVVQATPLKTS